MDYSDMYYIGLAMQYLRILTLVSIAMSIYTIVLNCILFSKAGVEGWKAIIPIYNTVIMFQLVGLNPLLILTCIIPVVNVVFFVLVVIANYRFARCFGASKGFAILNIFFGVITMSIMAFSHKYDYEGIY